MMTRGSGLLLALAACAASVAMGEVVSRRFVDNGAELSNPGMGWVFHYYDNNLTAYGSRTAPEDMLEYFPGLTQIYLRLPWSCLEPEEGQYAWSMLDTPMQRYRSRGLKASFRITCSETGFQYATPKWVQDAGAKGYFFTPGRGMVADGKHWEPDFADPVFLAKLENFLRVFAARYDGHPDVALIDIGSYGVWGEGHNWTSTRKEYPTTVVQQHLDLHKKYFQRTTVLTQDDFLSRPGMKVPVWREGLSRRSWDLVIARAWRGKSLRLVVGMVDGRQERVAGWQSNDEKMTTLGELVVNTDGGREYRPAEPAWPEQRQFPAGVEFAARCMALDDDSAHYPHSLKIPVEFWRPAGFAADLRPFIHVVDESGVLLHVCSPEKEDDELTATMAAMGFGLRDDSIMVSSPGNAYFHAKAAQRFWPRAPIYIESEHYGSSFQKGHWQDGFGFIQAIEDYHASYASIHWWPEAFFQDNRDLIAAINRIIGYRFLPLGLTYEDSLRHDSALAIRWEWQNVGVAPSYVDYYPALTLKNAAGGIVAVLVDDALNLRNLPVALGGRATSLASERRYRMPHGVSAGRYDVFLSVGDILGKPVVALPIAGDDGSRRYLAGRLSVVGDYALVLQEHAIADDGQLRLQLQWTMRRDVGSGLRPFLHVDDVAGRIVKTGGGLLAGDDPEALGRAGTQTGTLSLTLPVDTPEDTVLTVWSGLWWPARVGRSDERCVPDHGEGRRVFLGKIRRQDGAWLFTKP